MKTLNQLLGPLDPVWDECAPRSRKLTDRPGSEILFIAHHSVSRTLQSIEDTFKSPVRSVSATSGVGPLTAGTDSYRAKQYVPWNTHRPYTTASNVDDRAITFEMANLQLTPPYPVGQTGKQWAAEVAAAMHVELGMPLDRAHVTCHREIYERGLGSYPTQCPGDDLHDDLDWIVAEAKRIVASGNTSGGKEVKDYPFKDRTKKDIKPGGSARLRTKDGKPQNIVGAAGLYSVTHYVYAKGKPGDYLEVLLSLVDTRPSPDVSSDAHTQKFEFGSDGILKIAVESKITVKGGFAVHAKVRAPGTNVGNVTVTLQDSISYMFLG